MRRSIFAIVAVMAAGLISVGGCSNRKDVSKPIIKNGHDHDDVGPHQGALVEWGEEYHLEFTVDHAKKQATVYVLDENVEKPSPIPTETLTLVIENDKTPVEIELKADPDKDDPKGKSSKFVAVHDVLGKEIEFKGRIRGVVNEKPYDNSFAEKPGHHDKK